MISTSALCSLSPTPPLLIHIEHLIHWVHSLSHPWLLSHGPQWSLTKSQEHICTFFLNLYMTLLGLLITLILSHSWFTMSTLPYVFSGKDVEKSTHGSDSSPKAPLAPFSALSTDFPYFFHHFLLSSCCIHVSCFRLQQTQICFWNQGDAMQLLICCLNLGNIHTFPHAYHIHRLPQTPHTKIKVVNSPILTF